MAKAKTYTILIRGITKDQKNSLKRSAKALSWSVNTCLLKQVEALTYDEIEKFNNTKAKPK